MGFLYASATAVGICAPSKELPKLCWKPPKCSKGPIFICWGRPKAVASLNVPISYAVTIFSTCSEILKSALPYSSCPSDGCAPCSSASSLRRFSYSWMLLKRCRTYGFKIIVSTLFGSKTVWKPTVGELLGYGKSVSRGCQLSCMAREEEIQSRGLHGQSSGLAQDHQRTGRSLVDALKRKWKLAQEPHRMVESMPQ